MQALILIFLFCFGLFMIIKPDWLWKIDNFLDVKGGEPTDFYLVSTRLGGILLCLICFFIFVYFGVDKIFG